MRRGDTWSQGEKGIRRRREVQKKSRLRWDSNGDQKKRERRKTLRRTGEDGIRGGLEREEGRESHKGGDKK